VGSLGGSPTTPRRSPASPELDPEGDPEWQIRSSTHRERISENAKVFDFQLTDVDMVELDGLDRTGGTDRAHERKWW
jgi:hypothetical protein